MNIKVDFNDIVGKIKRMHAVNNGPLNPGSEQVRSNFETYKAIEFPYTRNHDASFCANYGGEHCVDVAAIFPDFNKNPYDAASYDFLLTDIYTQTIIDAGAKVFYRLGHKIEHWPKKYGVNAPADFKKWAIICEHIIRHYNEGWANGFKFDIEYWEIWNEADGIALDGTRPNWTGTDDDYYDLYCITAKHLKKCFPNIKVGGPTITGVGSHMLENFLKDISSRNENIPLDFFSYHMYTRTPKVVVTDAKIVKDALIKYGYENAEIILDEWNYLEDWTTNFINTIKAIISVRGAAFNMAVMIEGQKSFVDMLMYYDAQPGCFNSLFDYYTLEPLKGYYAMLAFSKLYKLGNEVKTLSDDDNIYVIGATDGKNKKLIISYFAPFNDGEPQDINIDCKNFSNSVSAKIIDDDNTMVEIPLNMENSTINFTMKQNSIVIIDNIQ